MFRFERIGMLLDATLVAYRLVRRTGLRFAGLAPKKKNHHHQIFKFAGYRSAPARKARSRMQDPLRIAEYYRDKAQECLRRAAREGVEMRLRSRYRRLAECYSGFAEAEERQAARQSRQAG